MKKLLILPFIILLLSGCYSSKRLLESYELRSLETDSNLVVVRHDFYDRVDAVFKYPYSSLYYGNSETNPYRPLNELAKRCFKSDLKIRETIVFKVISYKIASSQDEIDKCITQRANEPMDDYAISILSSSDIYEKYKNNPHFRTRTNNFKADGVITIKEYMDMYKALNEIREAEIEADNKKRITEL
ncbi:hypothetical protein A7M79_07460 [Acinetobacter baumannii]|uniref:hypothetical protein n=1 Tax=Acinetobacter baumannii TaxID=470 RepID=UPI0008DD056D|nr:hypothetical protein [Acinetobacter baumannii]OIH08644.1 hypothetical protein A7M79_07460 [Acinetobacter baumannii]